MAQRIYFTIDEGSHGGLQLSINAEDEGGYRICGPKYDGNSKLLKRHYITVRDIDEIQTYLTRAKASLATA